MNREISIEDMLKQLKDFVASESEAEAPAVKEKKQKNISDAALQKQLKNQYSFDASDADETDGEQGEYIIDSDFLVDALSETDVNEDVEDGVIEEELVEDDVVEEEIVEEEIVEEEIVEEEIVEELVEEETLEELIEEELPEAEIVEEEVIEEPVEEDNVEELVEEEIFKDKIIENEIFEDETVEELIEEELPEAEIVEEEVAEEELIEDEIIEEDIIEEELVEDEIVEEDIIEEDIIEEDIVEEIVEDDDDEPPFDVDDTDLLISEEEPNEEFEQLEEIEIADDSEEINDTASDDEQKTDSERLFDEYVASFEDSDTEEDVEELDDGFSFDEQPCEEEELPEDNVEELIAALKPIEDPDEYIEREPADVDDSGQLFYSDLMAEAPDDLPKNNVDELISTLKPVEFQSEDFEADDAYADADEYTTPEGEDISFVVAEVEKPQARSTLLATMRETENRFAEDEQVPPAEQLVPTNIDEDLDGEISEQELCENTGEYDYDSIDIIGDSLDSSTINIMMQFCEKEELDRTIGNKNVDEFLKQENSTVSVRPDENVSNGKEYVDVEQAHKIRSAYRKKVTYSLISLIACALLAVLTLCFEILPILHIRLSGALDYYRYPAVYALLGLQLLVFSSAFVFKKLWFGLKRAFSLTPTRHSAVAIVVVTTVAYDLIVAVLISLANDDLPCMYNAFAAVVIAISAFEDFMEITARSKAFGVFSDNAQKYTLLKEGADGRISSKMYAGGLDANKKIYSVSGVDFPNGFFKNLDAPDKRNRFINMCIIPTLVLGFIMTVIAVVFGGDAYVACSTFLLCIYALIPTAVTIMEKTASDIACNKLARRGSAFVGENSIDRYSDCDVMAFGDLHIFKKCKSEDVGIAIYDPKVGYLVLGCLDALYSKIGGPLSGLNIDLPEVFRFDDVSIRRMTQSGIEAVVDGRHTIIVGERAFLQRYGLVFPQNERENGRSTLCVSLDGKVTAKLSVRYQIEPIFEMIAERLNAEGITCAIYTFDPLINSVMISEARNIGTAPISVIHGSAQDFAAPAIQRYNEDGDGVISCASRLKLAELMIWLRRLKKTRKITEKISWVSSAVGAVTIVLLMSFGVISKVEQGLALLFVFAQIAACAVTFKLLAPRKGYFTVDKLYAELESHHNKMTGTVSKKTKNGKNANKKESK